MRFLSGGVAAAAAGLATAALNFTAVPVVLDLTSESLAIAALAVLLLLPGLWWEVKRPEPGKFRIGLGTAALLASFGTVTLLSDRTVLAYGAKEIRFVNDRVELAGTLYTPRARGPHPAVVVVHGSGPETRTEYAYYARLFARQNVVGLAYDKRGSGRSTGKLYESDYGDYARDALAAVQYLKQDPDVIPGCIGIMGVSEGEWVGALAATRSSDVAFLIIIAPSGVSPAQQVDQEIAIRLRARGYAERIVARALALNDRVFDYQRTGQGAETLKQDLREARGEPWFRDAQKIPEEVYPKEDYAWWRSVMDFAPAPVWEQVKVPVLLLKGGRDPKSDPAIAKSAIEAALAKGGNHNVQFIVFPEGNHGLVKWPLGEQIPPPVFVDGYLDGLKRWVGRQACGGA